MSGIRAYYDKDLSLLPAPKVLEALDYEALLAERKTALNALQPLVFENGQPILKQAQLIETDTERYWKVPVDSEAGLYYLDLESDPAVRLLQADVYRELLLRQRINEAALATMPAYARCSDLDHIGSRLEYAVHRLQITPETENPAVLEADEAYRKRILISPENNAHGGSKGWYLFNALSSSGQVKDAAIYSPKPYHITIVILQHGGDGTASNVLLGEVYDYVTSRYKFPQGDKVTVQSAEVITYTLAASIYMYAGPSNNAIQQNIEAAWQRYRAQSEKIKHWVTQSGVDAALHQVGVYRAVLNNPVLPLEISKYQAPFCSELTIEVIDAV